MPTRIKLVELGARCIAEKNDKLLFQTGPGGFYRFPGGHLRPEERLEECVAREMREEFGLKVKPKRLLYVNENFFELQGERTHELIFYFLCEMEGEGAPEMEEPEIRVEWRDSEEVLDLFKPKGLLERLMMDMKHGLSLGCTYLVTVD